MADIAFHTAHGNPTAVEPSPSVEELEDLEARELREDLEVTLEDLGVDLQAQVDQLEELVGALGIENFDLQVQIDALDDDLAQYACALAGLGLGLIDDGDLVMIDRDLVIAAIARFTQALGSSDNINCVAA